MSLPSIPGILQDLLLKEKRTTSHENNKISLQLTRTVGVISLSCLPGCLSELPSVRRAPVRQGFCRTLSLLAMTVKLYRDWIPAPDQTLYPDCKNCAAPPEGRGTLTNYTAKPLWCILRKETKIL